MSESFVDTFARLFKGRQDTWGIRRGNEYIRIAGQVFTTQLYQNHIDGKTMGIYPLLEDGKSCQVAAVDVDVPMLHLALQAQALLPQPNYVERSRSGNYHIWMFFEKPVDLELLVNTCQPALKFLKANCKEHCNIYPLRPQGIGVLIALPFQLDAMKKGNTIFIDAEPTLEAQHAFLKQIKYTVLQHAPQFRNKKLEQYFLGKGKTKGDISSSGYDFAFCIEMFKAGHEAAEIKQYLSKRPGVHKQDDDYLTRTVEKAKEVLQKTKNTMGAEIPTLPVKDWSAIEPMDRDTYFDELRKYLTLQAEQVQQFDMFFATMMANLKTKGRPVWMLFVGPPGCGKTLPMMAVQYAPVVHMISAFKPTALISGWGLKGQEDMSLMPRLDGKVLIVKDMSSLLSQQREVVAEVLGLLRDVYDGACSRVFGTGVERAYAVRFGFIGATTPDIDAFWALNVRLGERFIRYRCKAQPEQVYSKIEQSLLELSEETEVDAKIEDASLGFLKYLLREDAVFPRLSQTTEFSRLAQLGAILRTVVSRNTYGREVLVIPEWEEATRYAKQLAKLALGLAFIRGKETNGKEELEDIKTVIRDVLDARVEKICGVIYNHPNLETAQIADRIYLPAWTVRSVLDDLTVARIVVGSCSMSQTTWDFVPWLRGQLNYFQLFKRKDKHDEEREAANSHPT